MMCSACDNLEVIALVVAGAGEVSVRSALNNAMGEQNLLFFLFELDLVMGSISRSKLPKKEVTLFIVVLNDFVFNSELNF